MNVHSLEWYDDASPQSACADAMRNREPFVLRLDFRAAVGDLLIFPGFFVSYPVIRFAKDGEGRMGKPITFREICRVVCAEPPQEDAATCDVGEPACVGQQPR